jgi:DNA helicase-2/ATP-dependent DNA helicase PcrA
LDGTQSALILAGAGSGKTRVLTHRIGYLVMQKNVHIDAVLAVTFTNKAANEMRDRLNTLLRRPIRSMWVGTFHGLAHKSKELLMNGKQVMKMAKLIQKQTLRIFANH